MSGSRDNSLRALVRVLVQEWGHAKVQRAVEDALSLGTVDRAARPASEKRLISRKSNTKPTARQQVDKTSAPEHRKQILFRVAEMFDKRELMPSVADVRNFLEMRGFEPGLIKDRSDAFKAILRVMVVMSDDRLEKLARDSTRSGPNQLGPLSEAISNAASEARSRSTDARTLDDNDGSQKGRYHSR